MCLGFTELNFLLLLQTSLGHIIYNHNILVLCFRTTYGWVEHCSKSKRNQWLWPQTTQSAWSLSAVPNFQLSTKGPLCSGILSYPSLSLLNVVNWPFLLNLAAKTIFMQNSFMTFLLTLLFHFINLFYCLKFYILLCSIFYSFFSWLCVCVLFILSFLSGSVVNCHLRFYGAVQHFLLWCFVAYYYSPWVNDKRLRNCLHSDFENYLSFEYW